METITAPSSELLEIKLIPIDIENQKKWMDFFLKIPALDLVITTLSYFNKKQYRKLPVEVEEGEDYIFYVSIYLEPAREGEKDVVGIEFYKEGDEFAASVDETNSEILKKKYPKLLENFFGFKGTWEEASKKIIEINNAITVTPPFTL